MTSGQLKTWLSPPVPVLSESLLDIYVESDSVEPIDPTASREREGSFWVVAAGPEVDIPHPSSGLGAGNRERQGQCSQPSLHTASCGSGSGVAVVYPGSLDSDFSSPDQVSPQTTH